MQGKKKYVLAVQGEGRGHMTQAISLYELLTSRGHTVSAVLVGTSMHREIPQFFYDKVHTTIIKFRSPNFVTDKKSKSIRVGPSVLYNTLRLGVFRKSMHQIREVLEEYKPDAVINFYDLLIGFYYYFNKPKIPLICIAHQYIYLHKDFLFPKGNLMNRMVIRNYTRLTSLRSKKNIALSFYPLEDRLKTREVVVPPLLREDLFKLETANKRFYLAYLVNHGYFEDIVKWHRINPEFEIHCFADRTNELRKFDFDPAKLILHELSDKEFLEKMSECSGLISTAGFESVCEAMYLGKPVLMVPVEGHFEQFCNSRDAHYAGAGVYDSKFNIDKLVKFVSEYIPKDLQFKNWVQNSKERIYNELVSIT